MRPSTTSTRPSHAPGSQAPPSATLLARLTDKKKEIEAVEALQHASALFLRRLEGLADDCEVMADAGIGACIYPRTRAWLARPAVVPVTDIAFGGFRNGFAWCLLQCMARCLRNGHRCSVPWFCSVCAFPSPYDDNLHHTCFATAAAREASSSAITGDDGAGVDTDTDVPPGGRLVRVPIDELQADTK